MLLLLACASPDGHDSTPAPAPDPEVGPATPVVPGAALPAEVRLQDANNNLDVASFEGATWLAFRTAPTHFASADAVLHVMSDDGSGWTWRGSFTEGTDVREPRLLAWEGQLWFAYAVLGDDPMAFEPQGMKLTRWNGAGFDPPEWFYEPGFIPWRMRVVDGVPQLTAYVGGENIYEVDGEPIEVHWLTSTDGSTWDPVIPGQPVVHVGGASETDLAFTPDGALVAVLRNEAGDATYGWGSKICRAEPESLGEWSCVGDPKRYDSPLVFERDGRVWLIGRRNLTETGNFDLFRRELPAQEQALVYAADYWTRAKRCALWEVDPRSLTVRWVADLDSRGDTCFASALDQADGSMRVWNYSSPPDGEDDPSWLEGQMAPTGIYEQVVVFPT